MSEFGHSVRISAGAAGAKGLSWESSLESPGLRMTFEITRTTDEEPNDCKVSLYNLARRSQDYLQANAEVAVVEAGVGMLGVIGTLDVTKVGTERKGNDLVTTIEGGDGNRAYASARVNTALGPGSTYEDAFRACASSLGATLAYAPPVSAKGFPNGITLYGPVRDVLADLTETIGLEWSLQDAELWVLTAGKGRPGQALSVAPSTGLVESAKVITEDGVPGLEFELRLDARAQPGRIVQVAEQKGLYRLVKVIHRGDSFSGAFRSKCTALKVST